ncbi:hypothetical protein B0F90DRAFT_1623082 [Multifurca ochricompacta]|uniref:N-acetyltransferase ESCO acetyl-transferase domain-containing protein n=1 Tax=Multifurca ochricompacta TaxID=376703 RepID=A0AAD4QP63_9AGAM|nr:hypothetical protein B0F90DRAFT_1623082 [Multifurca ochricompacta]
MRSSSPFDSSSQKISRKRPLSERLSFHNTPQHLKRARTTTSTSSSTPATKHKKKHKYKSKEDRAPKNLTQLHFTLDSSVLRTCPLCDLTYTKGAPEDETLHSSHCARVQRGMQWRRDEERTAVEAQVCEVATGVKLKDGNSGRIISINADASGKIGSKLAALLQTISLHLSSPPLTRDVLRTSKVYLFLLPSKRSLSCETIAGCAIATHISTAMAVASPAEVQGHPTNTSSSVNPIPPPTARLVSVDPSSSLFCKPEPLSTPMGIPRLFVPSAYRRRDIALRLLDAAAATFVHACPLDPHRGEVAFTQPTASGKALMEKWGRGGARIYQE